MDRLVITDAMWTGWMGKLLYVPLLNVLVLLYVYIPGSDLGIAIVVLTILIRLVLYPSYKTSIKSQRDIQKIQPYIEKIKEQYKDDKKKQSEEVMRVYKEHNVNLFASCLPLIIQLPIIFALYRVFFAGLTTESLAHLYSWFPNAPIELHTTFLAFTNWQPAMIDLTERSIFLAIFAGLSQFFQSWITNRYQKKARAANSDNSVFSKMMGGPMMLYIFPVITLVIAWTLPAALGLYWATTTLTMAVQQIIIYHSLAKQEQKVIEATQRAEDEPENQN
ncbi:hypothetical protein DRH29_00895 [candidate division Kazan bacterium]|uniref:Membrane insertase YidC/Oxa/ALB C-terminal domain-containing protein n=1 Tax=candidate division Kazan bacterium TaxID=2202143 RepID=A0A420ZD47_UNCK3|nr:MAG: hypothetical protein DRH29_00895 [candidate division Kazan bacterium]